MDSIPRKRLSWPPESIAFLTAAAAMVALSSLLGDHAGLWQAVVLALAVIALGLPHGALDPWIARRSSMARSNLLFGGQYLGLVGLVVVVWWLLPATSLAAFLLFSAWHFGQDWRPHLPPAACAMLGLGLLALPASSHPEQVENIFVILSGPEGRLISKILQSTAWVLTPLMLATAVFLAWRNRWSPALELVGLVLLAWLVPALIYFVTYFCFLHSPRHFRHALIGVTGNSRKSAIRSAAIYTLITLILAVPFALILLGRESLEAALLKLIFIGLAALTVPHMLLMHRTQRETPDSS